VAEEFVFVSYRVTDFTPPIPGSTTARCHECGSEIWVEPTSRALLEKAGKVACSRCIPPLEIPMDQLDMPSPEMYVEMDGFEGPPGEVACRLCGERVTDRIFILMEHLLGHRPESRSLPARLILEEFR